MASVKMGTGKTIYYRGEYAINQIYCIYCAQCGSFDIGHKTLGPLSKGVVIGGALFVLLTFVYVSMSLGELCFSIVILLFGLLAIFITALNDITYGKQCRRCDNSYITKNHNLLEYPEDDFSILDIPYEKTMRFNRLE